MTGAVRANSQIRHESALTRIQEAAGGGTRPDVEDKPHRRFTDVSAFEKNTSKDLKPLVFHSHSNVIELNFQTSEPL